MTELIELNADVQALCKEFWKLRPNGTVHPQCCHGCPLGYKECGGHAVPSTVEAINRHTAAMNSAATKWRKK